MELITPHFLYQALAKTEATRKKDTPHYLSMKLLTMLLKRYVIQLIRHGCWAMDDGEFKQ